MDKIIRYTNAGHRFEIDGILEPGYTITITVIPNDGYEFITWLTHPEMFIRIENDENDNKRFNLTIEECGVVFSALFQPVEMDDETKYYFETLSLDAVTDYKTSHNFYTQVSSNINMNFSITDLKALTFIGVPNTITSIEGEHKTGNGLQYPIEFKEGLPTIFNNLKSSFYENGYKTYYILTGDGQDLKGELIITLK